MSWTCHEPTRGANVAMAGDCELVNAVSSQAANNHSETWPLDTAIMLVEWDVLFEGGHTPSRITTWML